MTIPKQRHMFLGGNTSKGFYSFFKYILSQEDANRIICLKGGPGTGKSSLMKKLAFHFLTNGYDVEQFHCSSDDQSLDGVVIKSLNIAVIDATAPHMIDPKNPGAVDEILDLAVALDSKNIVSNKSDILEVNANISNCFSRAYTFFSASEEVYRDWATLNNLAVNENLVIKFTDTLKNLILPNAKLSDFGKERHLFATAFTPNGIVSFTENISSYLKDIFVIEGEPGLYKDTILKTIGRSLQGAGYSVEYFHNPLIPEKLEHIVIPDLNTGVFSKNEISKVDLGGTHFNISDFCDKNKLSSLKDEIEFNKYELDVLLNKGLSLITEAKLLHDKLEKYYVENMDYSIVNNLYDNLVKKLEAYK